MAKNKPVADLGRRERQVLEIVFRLNEAGVADVRAHMPDPPAYDTVRTMLRILERKGFVKHRRQGAKYIYRPTQSRAAASRTALTHLMATFFQDSVADTMAAALDLKSDDLTDDDLARLESLIQAARREGR